jgi:hypothetical protein
MELMDTAADKTDEEAGKTACIATFVDKTAKLLRENVRPDADIITMICKTL